MRARWQVTILLLLSSSMLLLGCAQPGSTPPTSRPASLLQTSTPPLAASAGPATVSEDTPTEPTPTPAAGTLQEPSPAQHANVSTPLPAIALGTRLLALQTPPLAGQDVQQVQQRLLELGYRQVTEIDGMFGPQTEAAVRAFQMVNQLQADGVVGPETVERLLNPDATPGWVVVPIAAELCGVYLLLGSSYAGAWFDNQTTGHLLRGGEGYRLFAGIEPLETVEGGRPEQGLPINPPLGDTFLVPFNAAPVDNGGIAVGGTWAVQPRPVQVITDANSMAAYEAPVQEFLRAQGVVEQANSNPDIHLTVWRADLEGDGTEEVIIETTAIDRAGPVYSFILIQHDAAMTPVAVYIRPSETGDPFEWTTYWLSSLVDLNGDQTMELIIGERHFESGSVSVYELGDTAPTQRLNVWCGV